MATAWMLVCCQGKEAPPTGYVCLSVGIEDIHSSGTKSVLSADDIETRISGVTLAAYTEGVFLSSAYLSAPSGGSLSTERLPLDLLGERRAHIYALVNMGDLQQDLPQSEDAMASLAYRIPSYTDGDDSIRERGIPMAGELTYDREAATGTVIPVERLLAKMAVELTLHWEATLQEVRIRNLNRRLLPFGDSAALSADDVFHEEVASPEGLSSGTFVFYVPENIQIGVGSSVSRPQDKSRDNPDIGPRGDVLTYLEVTAQAGGRYEGSMTYRSYLGRNATDDFSLERNCRYTWKLHYWQDGTTADDWKHENTLSWTDWRYSVSTDTSPTGDDGHSRAVYSGDELFVYLVKAYDHYERGTLRSAGSFSPVDVTLARWEKEGWIPGDFLYDAGVLWQDAYSFRLYEACSEGEGYLRASLEDEMGSFSDRVFLHCVGPAPDVTLSVSPSSIQLGETVRLTTCARGEDVTRDVLYYEFYLNGEAFIDDYGTPRVQDRFHWYIDEDGYWSPAPTSWTPDVTGTFTVTAYWDEGVRELRSNTVSFTVRSPL